MIKPFDYVTAINTHKDIMTDTDNDALMEKDYNPFLSNRAFSYHNDSILQANEMNQRHHLDKKMQFDYLLNNIRPRKRFAKWIKNESSEDVSVIKEYYGYNNTKAIEALSVLSEEQLKVLRYKVQRGGKNGNKYAGDG
tara:strand:- start:3641 stop:4054 length:414 start_codon:yes stop_codon:yes gene_type:complete